MPFYIIGVDIVDRKTNTTLVTERHLAYSTEHDIDAIASEVEAELKPLYKVTCTVEPDFYKLIAQAEHVDIVIKIVRRKYLAGVDVEVETYKISEALRHIRENVSVREIIEDIMDEIRRYTPFLD